MELCIRAVPVSPGYDKAIGIEVFDHFTAAQRKYIEDYDHRWAIQE